MVFIKVWDIEPMPPLLLLSAALKGFEENMTSVYMSKMDTYVFTTATTTTTTPATTTTTNTTTTTST